MSILAQPSPPAPSPLHLLTKHEHREVGGRQAEEVEVGGRLERRVSEDHQTDGHVSDHARHEDQGVHHGDGEHHVQRQLLRSDGAPEEAGGVLLCDGQRRRHRDVPPAPAPAPSRGRSGVHHLRGEGEGAVGDEVSGVTVVLGVLVKVQ